MEKKYYIACIVLLSVSFLSVYSSIFSSSLLIHTDLPYLPGFDTTPFQLLPKAWDAQRAYGMGGVYTPFLWYFFVINAPVLLLYNVFHFSWELIERIVYFFPFMLFGGSSVFLYLYAKAKSVLVSLLGILVFFLNSYVLMLFSGGQMQILIAVSLIPALLLLFDVYLAKLYLPSKLTLLCFAGIFTLMCMYDIRIAFLGGLILGIRCLFELPLKNKQIIRLVSLAVVSLAVVVGTNFFWILPTLLHKSNPIQDLGPAFTSLESVKFFSFSPFEYPFSLLHPLWPHNTFGQVPFFSPLFLVIPLLACIPLIFLRKDSKYMRTIVFGSVLVILGAFFAKGAQDPFGSIYLWMFQYIPGFGLFRDSTKFYSFIVTGYIILIPLGYEVLTQRFGLKERGKCLLFLFSSLMFISPILSGVIQGLPGTFIKRTYPEEYTQVKDLLTQDATFSRVLWFPQTVPFSYLSPTHPGISAAEYFHAYSTDTLENAMRSPHTEEKLAASGVAYIIIPSDRDKNLYVTDRTYDRTVYLKVKQIIDSLPFVSLVQQDGDLLVYKTQSFISHLSLNSKHPLSWEQKAFWRYEGILPKDVSKDVLIFSESYDPGWVLIGKQGKVEIGAQNYNGLMSFPLDNIHGSEFSLLYTPQRYVFWGLAISLLSFLAYIGVIGYEIYKLKIAYKSR